MKLRHKFTLLLVGFALTLVLCMALVIQLSFDKGFKDFRTQQHEERMQAAAALIVRQLEAEQRSWLTRSDFYLLHPKRLRQLEWSQSGLEHSVPKRFDKLPFDHMYLLGAKGELLAGQLPVNQQPQTQVVLKLNGQQIGVLGSAAPPSFSRMERHFAEQQLERLIWISLIAVVLAVAVAWLVATQLSKRLERIRGHIEQLAAGDFEARSTKQSSDELTQVTQTLNELGRVLAAAETSRRQWTLDISHELRTPVAVLQAQLESLVDGVQQYSPKVQHTLLEQTQRLTRLIEDLYQLSLSDSGKLGVHKQPLDLAQLIQDSVQAFKPKFDAKDLTLKLNLPSALSMQADPTRMQQLLANLLENSLKYTYQGGQVQLSLEAKDKQALVCIEDSAPGVGQHELGSLFERFYRSESSRNRSFGGSGLGLGLSLGIVTAHGGHMQADHSELGGLKVSFSLPLE